MDESTKVTIEKYQAKMESLAAQLRKIKISINGLCELENEPPMYEIEGEASESAAKPLTIRPDQYFGRALATVVKEILAARSQRDQGAISLDDLFSLMIQGGYDFEGKDEVGKKRTLAITIGKNPAFTRLPNSNHVGLAEWYPGAAKKTRRNDDEEDLPIENLGNETSTTTTAPGRKAPPKPATAQLPAGTPEVFSTEGMPE